MIQCSSYLDINRKRLSLFLFIDGNIAAVEIQLDPTDWQKCQRY